jgi:hypothetical protein
MPYHCFVYSIGIKKVKFGEMMDSRNPRTQSTNIAVRTSAVSSLASHQLLQQH